MWQRGTFCSNVARVALFLFSWVVVGCADSTPGAGSEPPKAWINSTGFPVASPQKDLARWWARFDDPQMSKLIAAGLAGNPGIAAATARVREARARRDEANAQLMPSLGGSLRGIGDAERANGEWLSNSSGRAALEASWEVDWFGKNRKLAKSAAATFAATEENLRSVQASLAAEIAIAYTRLRIDEERLFVLRDIVVSREETARLASWRQQVGEADSLESSQASASLEQARAAIPTLEQSIAQGRNQLALLCGREPGAFDAALASARGRIPIPARDLAIGIPADTIRQRPDVRESGWKVSAAVAELDASKARRYPSLNLSGSLGINSLAVEKIFRPENTAADLIAGVTGPIFDAGRIRADIEARGAALDRSLQDYRASVLAALSEVEDALIACRRSGERLATLEKAVASARDAATLAQQRYQAGVTDLITVLDAQRTLLGIEDNLLASRAEHIRAYIDLYKALGGGWS
jgi:NodT family efflux transporter outer membrane factor (OMF) lipoprotein